VSVRGYIPDRGDLVWLDFTPQSGREQAGRRPALVLTPRAYNQKTSLAICCPITSQIKGYPFEVVLGENAPVKGVVLADHLKSLDWEGRKAEFKGKASQETLATVTEKIGALLAIE
jgi:mRNA interferase MazF